MVLKKISLVTATYNQADFIRETFASIKNQNYKNLEYIVFDGNSNDETVSIIKEHEAMITCWKSENDNGAAEAIHNGYNKSTGELINWLNSDDILLPNTLHTLNVISEKFPNYDIYAFLGLSMGLNGGFTSSLKKWDVDKLKYLFDQFSFAQESTFVRREFLIKNDIEIDVSLSNIFDTILYKDCLDNEARILFVNSFGGVIRHHQDAKTSIGMPNSDKIKLKKLIIEQGLIFKILKRIYVSRLKFILYPLKIRFLFKFICLVCKKPAGKFNMCNFIGYDIFSSDSWQIKESK